MRGETENEDVKAVRVNDECVTDEEKIKGAVKKFWKDRGVDEVFHARGECLTLERKDAG